MLAEMLETTDQTRETSAIQNGWQYIDIAKVTGTQPRAAMDADTITDYADAMVAGAEFPPIIVFALDTDEDVEDYVYYIADGWHRLNASRAAGFTGISAVVHYSPAPEREALESALKANVNHGLRRSVADKRRSVELALNDDEWSQWSNNQIAKLCGVSDKLVGRLRKELFPEDDGTRRFTDKHGNVREMQTKSIGAKLEKAPLSSRFRKGDQVVFRQGATIPHYQITEDADLHKLYDSRPDNRGSQPYTFVEAFKFGPNLLATLELSIKDKTHQYIVPLTNLDPYTELTVTTPAPSTGNYKPYRKGKDWQQGILVEVVAPMPALKFDDGNLNLHLDTKKVVKKGQVGKYQYSVLLDDDVIDIIEIGSSSVGIRAHAIAIVPQLIPTDDSDDDESTHEYEKKLSEWEGKQHPHVKNRDWYPGAKVVLTVAQPVLRVSDDGAINVDMDDLDMIDAGTEGLYCRSIKSENVVFDFIKIDGQEVLVESKGVKLKTAYQINADDGVIGLDRPSPTPPTFEEDQVVWVFMAYPRDSGFMVSGAFKVVEVLDDGYCNVDSEHEDYPIESFDFIIGDLFTQPLSLEEQIARLQELEG